MTSENIVLQFFPQSVACFQQLFKLTLKLKNGTCQIFNIKIQAKVSILIVFIITIWIFYLENIGIFTIINSSIQTFSFYENWLFFFSFIIPITIKWKNFGCWVFTWFICFEVPWVQKSSCCKMICACLWLQGEYLALYIS